MKWLEQSYIFTSTWHSNAQSSFIQKFKLDFWDSICRHLVFHWRKISYFKFNYIYVVLLLLSWCLALAKKYKVVGVVSVFMIGTTLINIKLLLLLLLACNWCLKFDMMQVSTLHMMFFWWSGHLINLHIYLNFLEIHPCYLLYTGREWFKKMSSSFC